MNFQPTLEQRALAETLGRALADRFDAAELRRYIEDESARPRGLWDTLADLGCCALLVDGSRGGLDLGLMEASVVAGQLGRYLAPTPMRGHFLACMAIALAGSEEQRDRLLPGLAAGALVGGACLNAEAIRLEAGQATGSLRGLECGDGVSLMLVVSDSTLALVHPQVSSLTPGLMSSTT